MADSRSNNDTTTSFICWPLFRDCFESRHGDERTEQTSPPRSGVERQMKVLDQQPHLVEPMKLTVYEELPLTAIEPHTPTGSWSQLSKDLRGLSRVTSHSNTLFGMSRRPTGRRSTHMARSIPVSTTRQVDFSPLELSFYLDEHRLSDLPDFGRLSVTSVGELKMPPKAVTRAQSEYIRPVPTTPRQHNDRGSAKSKSMFEVASPVLSHNAPHPTQPKTKNSPSNSTVTEPDRSGRTSPIASTSRPASELDPLRSHPVSWSGLPGLPPSNKGHKTDNSVDIMTPMWEEAVPEPDSPVVVIDGLQLMFPQDGGFEVMGSPQTDNSCPSPAINRSGARTASYSFSPRSFTYQPSGSSPSHARVAQWLKYRSRSGSVSTIDSVSTTQSFAENRRKRHQFYQLGRNQQANAAVSAPTSPASAHQPPAPIRTSSLPPVHPPQLDASVSYQESQRPQLRLLTSTEARNSSLRDQTCSSGRLQQHQRTVTASTLASVDTDVLSPSHGPSDDAFTTVSEVKTVRSRTGTMHSHSTASNFTSPTTPYAGARHFFEKAPPTPVIVEHELELGSTCSEREDERLTFGKMPLSAPAAMHMVSHGVGVHAGGNAYVGMAF